MDPTTCESGAILEWATPSYLDEASITGMSGSRSETGGGQVRGTLKPVSVA